MTELNNEIYHHGIKGMKWGVRRYRNYDGSYTKAGLKRYDDSMQKYERANDRYKLAKLDLKMQKKNKDFLGDAKAELKSSKMAKKAAKSRLNKDYDHLKLDKLGDEGKALYANSKRITANNNTKKALKTIGFLPVAVAATYYDKKGANTKTEKIALTALSAIGGATIASGYLYGNKDNKRLRAFYGHTSNY